LAQFEFPEEAVWKSAKSSLALLLLKFEVLVGLLVVFVAFVLLLENEDKDIKSNGSCFGAAGLLGCIVDWGCIVLPKPPLEGCIVLPKPPFEGCIVAPNPEDWDCIILLKPIVPPNPDDCGFIGEPKPDDCGCIVEPKPDACGCIGEAWKANGKPVDGFIEVVLPILPKLELALDGVEVLYKDKILDLKSFCLFEFVDGLAVVEDVLLNASIDEDGLLLFEEPAKSWNKKISWLELEFVLLDGFLVLVVENTPWTSSVLTNGLQIVSKYLY